MLEPITPSEKKRAWHTCKGCVEALFLAGVISHEEFKMLVDRLVVRFGNPYKEPEA